MSELRMPHIGKYMRDRYTDDLKTEKRAMVEAQLSKASREDLEKAAGMLDTLTENFNHSLAMPLKNFVSRAMGTAPKPSGRTVSGKGVAGKVRTFGDTDAGKQQASQAPTGTTTSAPSAQASIGSAMSGAGSKIYGAGPASGAAASKIKKPTTPGN